LSCGAAQTVRIVALMLFCAATGVASADDADVASAAALHAKYVSLKQELGRNAFQRPLHLHSTEARDTLAGDVHAIIDSPFDTVRTALADAASWCAILSLPVNTKACRVTESGQGSFVSLWVGTKSRQVLADASRVDFAYRTRSRTAGYLLVTLSAAEGPMATHDYRVVLEAVPLENGRTFFHLSYSYGYGVVGRLAMNTYLSTIGRTKVGFTVVGAQPNGEQVLVAGMRGAVERNAMRYYLAIEAFFGALSGAAPARFEKRLRDWYAATEQYARQLHEIEPEEYFNMKRHDNARQQLAGVRVPVGD
jgi:hypothetical protein